MEKKIEVRYWHSKYSDLPYEHGLILKYSTRKRNQIINNLLSKGYSAMIRPMSKASGWANDGELIWIDKGRFGQS